ncbi:metal-sulfur cluster assembly factor [Leuconostoc mesenteroides]
MSQTIESDILEALQTVVDPELRIDIVNLGLIYHVDFIEKTGLVIIQMTLTTMGCPLVEVLEDMIRKSLMSLAEVKDVDIQLVWEPAWSIEKMSRYARISLGLY